MFYPLNYKTLLLIGVRLYRCRAAGALNVCKLTHFFRNREIKTWEIGGRESRPTTSSERLASKNAIKALSLCVVGRDARPPTFCNFSHKTATNPLSGAAIKNIPRMVLSGGTPDLLPLSYKNGRFPRQRGKRHGAVMQNYEKNCHIQAFAVAVSSTSALCSFIL